MISLVPSWANRYQEYWEAIRKRNLWLINLRYGAVIMLFMFLISSKFILGLKFTQTQLVALSLIDVSVLFYNIILQQIRKILKYTPGKFNPLHFSLLQMILDLTVLGLIVYFTGGIETPLFMLFVFHMIIGSLILPGFVIYSVAGIVVLFFNILVFGEYYGIIPHQTIQGLLNFPLYNNIKFLIAYDVVFTFVIFISVFLANKIARQLYQIEQELIETIDKLNTAEVEKQKYIIGIVHELKTPLSAVHSYLDVILKKFLGPLDRRVEVRLNRAKVRSGEAIDMINDVLKISKLRLLDEISLEDVELGKIAVTIIKKLTANIKAKHIMLNFIDGRTFIGTLKGDKLLYEIVFSNLIGNAVKYVGNNGLIEITFTNSAEEEIIKISDNGIGIPAQDMDKIFTDFYRASNIKEKSYEGTGLGLSVVKQIIERHNGKISVESPSCIASENKPGASFTITLPYSK